MVMVCCFHLCSRDTDHLRIGKIKEINENFKCSFPRQKSVYFLLGWCYFLRMVVQIFYLSVKSCNTCFPAFSVWIKTYSKPANLCPALGGSLLSFWLCSVFYVLLCHFGNLLVKQQVTFEQTLTCQNTYLQDKWKYRQ